LRESLILVVVVNIDINVGVGAGRMEELTVTVPAYVLVVQKHAAILYVNADVA
jgi:hypothetical protein